MIDLKQFRLNQSRVPQEELKKHNGKYVAWSQDGTHILASDANPQVVEAAIRAAGLEPGDILVAFICVPEEVSWGGVFLTDDSAQP
jgi:hypothetical protein